MPMAFTPEIHHRRSIRLPNYDYSHPGAYFVTICTQNREWVLGEISEGGRRLNDLGRMVERWWAESNCKFTVLETDEYIIMPNHFHGIVMIHYENVGAALRGRPDQSGETGHPRRGAPTGERP